MTGVSGWRILLLHQLRRDRWMLGWWTLGVVVLFWSQGVSIIGLYADQAEFDRAAAAMDGNAAFVAMAGPARALDTVGGQVFWQSSAFGAVVVGLMSMFIVGRHSRAEEESGRDELLRGGAIGRRTPLLATVSVAVLANLLVGLLVSASLLTVRTDTDLRVVPLPVADTLATGIGLAACGWVFTGTALVAAQLTQSTRAMYGIAGLVLGSSYLLRAVGDVTGGAWSWLSPIGWYQALAAYAELTWWPLLVTVPVAALLAAGAFLLFERRDVGAGLWGARPGPASAGPGLASGLGLAWRLHRGMLVGWSLGLLLVGLSYGSIGDSVRDLVGDSDLAAAFGAGGVGDIVDGFYASSIVLLGLMASGYAISSTSRPRSEEESGHAEVLLATGLSRRSWLAGHVVITAAGTVVVILCAAIGLGSGYALTTGDASAFERLSLPALAQVAPVLLLAATARLLYGLWPRLGVLAWLPLLLAVVVLMFGETLRIPRVVQGLSPFEHLALAPAEPFRWAPVLAVGAAALAISLLGQLLFARRDVG